MLWHKTIALRSEEDFVRGSVPSGVVSSASELTGYCSACISLSPSVKNSEILVTPPCSWK